MPIEPVGLKNSQWGAPENFDADLPATRRLRDTATSNELVLIRGVVPTDASPYLGVCVVGAEAHTAQGDCPAAVAGGVCNVRMHSQDRSEAEKNLEKHGGCLESGEEFGEANLF